MTQKPPEIWRMDTPKRKIKFTYHPFKVGIFDDDVPFPVWWDMSISWGVPQKIHVWGSAQGTLRSAAAARAQLSAA